jgi:hypothetical protein
MKTSVFIDSVMMAVPSVTRAKVLDCINYGIDYIVDRPLAFLRYKDPATGKDLKLQTTDGVYQYTLDVATVGVDVN